MCIEMYIKCIEVVQAKAMFLSWGSVRYASGFEKLSRFYSVEYILSFIFDCYYSYQNDCFCYSFLHLLRDVLCSVNMFLICKFSSSVLANLTSGVSRLIFFFFFGGGVLRIAETY